MSASFDCLTCGACCVSPFLGEGYIQLAEDEAETLERRGLPVFEIVSEPVDARLVLLGTRDLPGQRRQCVCLDGTPGERVACTIYETRPSLCRQFEAGSPECLDARRALGMPADH